MEKTGESEVLRNENERLDELLRNSYRIIQNTELFCFGMDAVLLSGFVRANASDRLMDLCTGNGVIPILLCAKTDCPHMAGMEIQEESADLARRSVELNGLTDRIDIITGDIKKAPELFPKASFSVVTANPPYMNENSGLINPSSAKAVARHELLCTLEDVIRTAAYLLSPGSSFYMVHRPHRLPDIIDLMRRYRIEPKRLRMVYPSKEKEPNMILIEGASGGNPFLRVEPPLIIFREDGNYSEEVSAIYANEEPAEERKHPAEDAKSHSEEEYLPAEENTEPSRSPRTGILYLCATPIGNLGDMTMRCIDTLSGADLIAAEDTRGTIKLLNHFNIHTPMTSYHEHNKYEKADDLIRQLLSGKNIALVTDAGTPGISDPGEVLVQKCMENDIPVTSLPGGCALISALILSGLSTRRFSFEGFLPSEKKEREAVLKELETETRTVILYEAPHRLKKALEILKEALDPKKITICRELTKRFEEIRPFQTIAEAEGYYKENEPKGEFVLVLEGRDPAELLEKERAAYEEMSIEEHVKLYLDQGMDRKEAMKQAAKDRGISKREIYQALL